MFSLETFFDRILFAGFMQILCLVSAISGIVGAAEHEQHSGVVKFLSKSAISFTWLVFGTVILPRFDFSHSLAGLTVYTIWGTLGIIPFILPAFKKCKKENPLNYREMISGMITVLFFCGALSWILYYECVVNGTFLADKLFGEESLNTVCAYLMLPVILFFTPGFSILSLILGTIRKKSSGFFRNLLLLAVAPVGFIIFTGTALQQLGKIHSGQADSIFSIFATAVCWVIFMFVPYGFMIWRGRKEHDNVKFYNGIAGIWAVHFLMFGLFLLAYISRNR